MSSKDTTDPFGINFTFTFEDPPTPDDRAKRMYDAIDVLLTNLLRDPEKKVINWPDRIAQIAEFRTKLQGILHG